MHGFITLTKITTRKKVYIRPSKISAINEFQTPSGRECINVVIGNGGSYNVNENADEIEKLIGACHVGIGIHGVP